MSTFCACMGPKPGHRFCPCRERQGFREPIHPIRDVYPRLLQLDPPKVDRGTVPAMHKVK